jgi:transposase
MRKIKEVLRLKWERGLSNRQIAAACGVSRPTVSEYLRRLAEAGLNWPLPEDLGEARLEQMLFPPPPDLPAQVRGIPDWKQIHDELKGKYVTLFLLWQEYRQANPEGYQYSWFCEHYRAWQGKLDLVMRQDHRAGEKLFVDYAGQTVPVIDRTTGGIHEAQIFVAVMGASNYTYAEATWSQKLPDWIGSHIRVFQYLNGVPELVVPDYVPCNIIGEQIIGHLAERGMLMREGTIVDATIIAEPPSTKNQAKARDPEMHQAKKGNGWHFGMKAHIGTDADSGLVQSLTGTAANVTDITESEHLLHGDETEAYADAGYTGVAKRPEFQRSDVVWYVAEKRGKLKKMEEGPRKTLIAQRERVKAQIRTKVEHPFHVVKNLFRHRKVRYRGLLKNTAQLFTLFGLANLVLARRLKLSPSV